MDNSVKDAHIAELKRALPIIDTLDKIVLEREINALEAFYDNDVYFQRRIDAWND